MWLRDQGLQFPLQPAGYQAVADAFFEAIVARIPQTPLASVR